MRVCDIKECGKPSRSRGLCDSHYMVHMRSGLIERKTETWTKEVKALVAGMLLEKLSASQIAARLPVQVSRNAVVGVVHRDPILKAIGLQGGSGAIPKKRNPRLPGVLAKPRFAKPYRKPRALQSYLPLKELIYRIGDTPDPDWESVNTQVPKPPQRAIVSAPVFECRSVPLMELQRGECKWPVNDAAPSEHLFCGNPANTAGPPYCARHAFLSVGRGTESERRAIRDFRYFVKRTA